MRGGGGIVNASGPTVRLLARNTILAGNMASTAPDLAGNLTSSGYNLIGNTDGAGGFDPTDLLNVDPLLGPLQNNGGPTQTMALQCGSPAIDAGDNTDAPDWDQRGEGFPRIVNGIIDIGAYEVQKGECDGSAPHGSSGRLNRFNPIGLAVDSSQVLAAKFANISHSADPEARPILSASESVAIIHSPSERFSIPRPLASLPLAESLLIGPILDFRDLGIEGVT